MNKKNFFFAFLLSQMLAISFAQDDNDHKSYFFQFSPNTKTSVDISVTEKEVFYTIRIMKGNLDDNPEVKYGNIEYNDGGNPADFIMIDDFDFNGDLDFAIKSTDIGMVGHDIYSIFLYSREKNDFVQVFGSGDGFIYLKVDKEKKRLLTTCWVHGVPQRCVTKLKMMK
jgi:hypothetical protein